MRTESQQFYSYVFDFPDSADLTRFDFYAPFIKTLQVPGICVINNLPVEWAILTSSEAIAAKPLLPNLEHLKLDTSGPVEEIHIKWLSRFLCPGLLGFEMLPVSSRSDREDYYPWLDMNTSLHLIDQLSRACPRLKLLQIFPGETSLWPSGQREMMWSRIAELQHLRSLNFSGVKVYNELLNTLGRLPHLENLSFCANKNDPVNDDLPEFRVPLHVPDDSFPSLRNLYLQGLFEDTMNRLFKVPVLFRRSIIVKIIFAFQPFEYRLDMTERSNTLIECLSQNSPHLEDLTIGLLGKYGCFIVTRLAVDAFRHMHLRYLSLTIVNFDSDVELEDFLASVPHLEVLDLGLQQLEPDIFQPFGSHLPKLGLLFFGTIDLENAKELLEKVEQQAASQPIVLCGQAFLEHQWRQPGVPYSPPSDESIYNVASSGIIMKPLLPNLERLIMNTLGDRADESHVKWVSRFLYRGLLAFEMLPSPLGGGEDYYPWLDVRTSFYLIDQVSRACPHLETLIVFPGGTSLWSSGQRTMTWNHIAKLQHLRSFTFSGVKAYNELLNVLGRLPYLENLLFCTSREDPVNNDVEFYKPLHVPDNSFPSLQYLCLQGLFDETMARLFKVPVLFRHLIKTTIVFLDGPFFANVIECLDQNSSRLEDLTIKTPGRHSPFVVTRSAIEAFKHMPLRCLSLDTANFSEVKWEDFLNSVPDLEELHIGLQHLEPQHFQLFASRLPKLRLLCFGIADIGDVNESSERASQRIVPRPVILRGHAYFGPLPLQSSNAYNPPSAESISNAASHAVIEGDELVKPLCGKVALDYTV
ncbi:hypothetical protein FRC09_012069 [Ceratobasidium sp. 395]|nr:hypothetical protein FRC09_012069 [Ceratobasidium sp. 395]